MGGGTATDEVHRVQILDPATGTGTFLASVVNQIAPKIQNIAPALWSQYIEQDLIPRLHGFELLMASYAMCHLKLNMLLTEMEYKPTKNPPRLSVYLTNSLEEGENRHATLPFTKWLSDEGKGANHIKSNMPIMCVIGNPPYSGISSNNGEWIKQLIEPYKKEPGGNKQLEERNSKWINDDYVKFIRFAEYMISNTGEGILGFITNHGYLDNPTFRGMRWHLLKTFNRIYVLDLHGNANKKEMTPEGKPDKNVFDILQGVAILIAIKVPKNTNDLAEVYHGELWGSREDKYDSLLKSEIDNPYTKKIECLAPQYPFVKRDNSLSKIYQKGFKLVDFMTERNTGIVTARDNLVIDFTKTELIDKIYRFTDPTKSDEQVRNEFFSKKISNKYLPGDNLNWKVPQARMELQNSDWESDILPIAYRPFDTRYILYRKGMIEGMRQEIMQYLYNKDNFALSCCRQNKGGIGFHHVFCHNNIAESSLVSNKSSEISYCFPLYLYSERKRLDEFQKPLNVNFDEDIFLNLKDMVKQSNGIGPDEVAVFDYIYGVLHCPKYRHTFSEFLKIDFPYIPWPSDAKEFWDISEKGSRLRKLHLMDATVIGRLTPHRFNGKGKNTVSKPRFEEGRIWINSTQHFDNVNSTIWEFNIGGYQPAQKWLKDRKGRILSFDDVKHYWMILNILEETKKVMQSITITLDDPR